MNDRERQLVLYALFLGGYVMERGGILKLGDMIHDLTGAWNPDRDDDGDFEQFQAGILQTLATVNPPLISLLPPSER
jgi:hypothetical protein